MCGDGEGGGRGEEDLRCRLVWGFEGITQGTDGGREEMARKTWGGVWRGEGEGGGGDSA